MKALRPITKDGKPAIEEVWANRKMKVGQGNLMRIDDHIYGASGSESVSFISAVNAKTGELAWQERGFPKAMIVYADKKVIILDEDGRLVLATASPSGLDIHSDVAYFKERTWTAPTIVGTTMYLRDRKTLLAVDLE
jgi:hypothetical protein